MFHSRHPRLFGFIALVLLLSISTIPVPASAASFVVNTIDDANDGICDTNHCSLREAINAANVNPGPDTISFEGLDATGGSLTIQLASFLPPLLDDGTTIDGTTALGYSGEPVINVVKASGVIEDGIAIQSNGNTVRGLSFAGFGSWPGSPDPEPMDLLGGAIVITGSSNLIEANELGWGAWANSVGIRLAGGGNSVIGNVIPHNGVGIYVLGPGQVIQGNKIGVDASGTVAIGNRYGIYDAASSGGGHAIGGPGAGTGNQISANHEAGVMLRSDNNVVEGNFIGTDPVGSSAVGAQGHGIVVYSSNNVIGSPGHGNLISGNTKDGINLSTPWNSNNVIQGNLLGTDLSGTAPIPNQKNGLFYIDGGGSIIGGPGPGEGNIAAFNFFDGIEAEGPDHQIVGNQSFKNGHYGVEINDDSLISRNRIFDNGDLGIYASLGGQTPIPVLSSSVSGTVSGMACPQCTVEVFLAAPDPSGSGEGKEYLGSAVTDQNGHFQISLPGSLPHCSAVTATATDSRPRTSRFSQNTTAKCFRLPPLYLIPIWSFIIIVFGAIGVLIRRGRPDGSRWIIPGSLALGGLAGGGIILLGLAVPGVKFEAEKTVPYQGQPPSCEAYLDATGFTPPDGSDVAYGDDVFLGWMPGADLPGEPLRWRVNLEEVGVTASMQVTEENSMAMSALGLTPAAAGRYEWSVFGERQLPDGETWLTFCEPSGVLTFQIEAEPGEAPEEEAGNEEAGEATPTSEPVACEPTLTALINLTCRSGPLQDYTELGYLLEGETAIPEGQNEDGTWFWILNPDWQGHCWVWSGGLEALCMPDRLASIPYDPLPTDTPATPVCRRDLSRADCGDAGGIFRPGTESFCECP
jgi:CSLREA domain-containing protein